MRPNKAFAGRGTDNKARTHTVVNVAVVAKGWCDLNTGARSYCTCSRRVNNHGHTGHRYAQVFILNVY